MTKDQIEMFLARLRAELFTAAQRLEGESLEAFRQLIADVHGILEVEK